MGFHDPDHHELCFYAVTQADGARDDATRAVRPVRSTSALAGVGTGR